MDRFRATEINLAAVRLIIIESIETQTYRTGEGVFVYGALEPFAVVTCRPDGTRAIDLQANQISLSELTRAVPQLTELIDGPTDA